MGSIYIYTYIYIWIYTKFHLNLRLWNSIWFNTKRSKSGLTRRLFIRNYSSIPNRIYKCFTNMITQPTVPVMLKALQAKFLAYHPGPSKGHPPEHFHSSCWQKKGQKLLRHSNSDAGKKGAKDASLLPKIQALSCPSEIEAFWISALQATTVSWHIVGHLGHLMGGFFFKRLHILVWHDNVLASPICPRVFQSDALPLCIF